MLLEYFLYIQSKHGYQQMHKLMRVILLNTHTSLKESVMYYRSSKAQCKLYFINYSYSRLYAIYHSTENIFMQNSELASTLVEGSKDLELYIQLRSQPS